MSQLAVSDGQPGNWEEPDFLWRRLEIARSQEEGWKEPYDGRLSRTDLGERRGEIPLRHLPVSAKMRGKKPVILPSPALGAELHVSAIYDSFCGIKFFVIFGSYL